MITIGSIHGGKASNVIPDTVEMTGTIRSYTPEVRKSLHDELQRAVRLVEALGGKAELTIKLGYPPTVNSPDATANMVEATRQLLGADKVLEAEMVMGAEDFSYMAQAAPGCFWWSVCAIQPGPDLIRCIAPTFAWTKTRCR